MTQRRSALEPGPLVHRDAVHERGHHPRLADLAGGPVEQVTIEHDQVGRLADLDRADLVLEVVDPRRTHREGGECVVEPDPLIGQERRLLTAMQIADPVDRDLDLEQWIGGGHAPVRAHRQPRPGAQQRTERVDPVGELRAEEGEGQELELILEGGPVGLGVGRYVERAEAFDVGWIDELDVGDVRSRVARAVIVGQPAVAIEGSRGDLIMGMLTAPGLGRVATWMARLPSPRLSARWGLREAAGAHAARQVSDDIVDLHVLAMRLPGQATSFRSLQKRLLVGRTPRREHVLTDAELRSFTVPLLFVWPENDRFLAPAAGKPSVDKIPTARFVTMPGGHFPWYDDPDRCSVLVAEGL